MSRSVVASYARTLAPRVPESQSRRVLPVIALLFLASAASADREDYVLSPGDVISILVVEHPEHSARVKVRPDGRVNLPVLGDIEVAGVTSAQLTKILETRLVQYVNNPVVSVSIELYGSNKVFVIGALLRTGSVEIYEPMEVTRLIALCGGLKNPRTAWARVLRSDGTTVQVNLREAYGKGGRGDMTRVIVYPGDTFLVPEPVQVPWAMITTILAIVSGSLGIYLALVGIANR